MKKSFLGLAALLSLFVSSSALADTASNPDWMKTANIYEVNVRQFSNDSSLNSVTKAIPRLKALGVQVIWLMPIYPVGKVKSAGPLGSPYAVADYKAVNPEFGKTNDLKTLIDTVHANGMHIILDWVANHTAWDNPWVSAHPDWYTQVNGQIISPAGTNWNDVADLNYSNQAMRLEMISAMKYWVTDFNVDGFRCDAAGMVPQDFWEQAATELAKVKPLFMLAEDNDNLGLLNKAFNANYNWQLRDTMKSLASGLYSPADLQSQQYFQNLNYPANTYSLNFITNHDDNSWTGTVNNQFGQLEDSMAVLTYTLPGVPLIYNGQEIGLYRQLKFFEKDPINWKTDAHNGSAKTLLYKRLNALKADNPSLYSGNNVPAKFIDVKNPKVVAFTRTSGSNKVIVLVNTSDKSQVVKLTGQAGSFYTFGATKATSLGKSVSMTLKAKCFAVWSSQK